MRQPSEYIAAAIRGIQGRLMRDCAHVLCVSDCETVVTLVSSARKPDEVKEDTPSEAVRVLAESRDLPCVRKGDGARLDGILHIVTSFRTDPTGVSAFVGLSEPLMDSVTVICREADDARLPVRRFALDSCLVIASELSSDAGATVHAETARAARVVIPLSSWNMAFEPRFGMRIEAKGLKLTVKEARRTAIGWELVCTHDERAEVY